MRGWIRSHLTYANVMSTLAVFLVIGGGTALASYVISSNTQVGPGTISGHNPPTGKHSNIIPGSINGADIANRSGVDTCPTPATLKFGPICAGSPGVADTWPNAANYCAGLGLRLPTHSEAMTLAEKYNVPGVNSSQGFWTDDTAINGGNVVAATVNEDGIGLTYLLITQQAQTVCVTDPSA